MNKLYHYLYIIFNLVNGKVYVGRRSCDCLPIDDPYFGSGYALWGAIRKYGKENFEKEIIEECKWEELREKEIEYIKYFDANNKKVGYNLTSGGEDGDWWNYLNKEEKEYYTEQARIRSKRRYDDNPSILDNFFAAAKAYAANPDNKKVISERFTKMWQNEETRNKIVSNVRERTGTPEYRKYASKRAIEYFKKPENRLKHSQLSKDLNARPEVKEAKRIRGKELWQDENYVNKVLTNHAIAVSKQEYKSAQSLRSKAIWDNPLRKEKHKQFITDKWQNDEDFKEKMKHRYDEGHPNALFIVSVNINTKEWDVYMSTEEAGKKLGLYRKSISKCCKNQYGVYEGYVFAFVEDFDENNIDKLIEEKKKLPELKRIEKKPNKSIAIIKDMAIQEFTSVKSACNYLSLDAKTVFRILKGERKNCYKGYSFYEV